MRKLSFALVDAFASGPYAGNPAGVVLNADGLRESQMQAISREINASETAFIANAAGARGGLTLRWFTPTVEVGFCGHATLAAAHAITSAGVFVATPSSDNPGERIAIEATPDGPHEHQTDVTFESKAGTLIVQHGLNVPGENPGAPAWWLTMPEPGLRPEPANPVKLAAALGLQPSDFDPQVPPMRTRDDDLIVLINSWQALNALKPDMAALTALSERGNWRGVLVASTHTLDGLTDVVSRFFAPAAGVNEDPVTGSVHGPLATLLVQTGKVAPLEGAAVLTCQQGIPGGRGGMVRALVEQTGDTWRVRIGGHCHLTLRGELIVPAS